MLLFRIKHLSAFVFRVFLLLLFFFVFFVVVVVVVFSFFLSFFSIGVFISDLDILTKKNLVSKICKKSLELAHKTLLAVWNQCIDGLIKV